MENNFFFSILAVSSISVSSLFASHTHHYDSHSHKKHHEEHHGWENFHGSFVSVRGSTAEDAVMDQYMFNQDGTVYWNQSLAFNLPITTGTFIPSIGTWARHGRHIIATTVSADFGPVKVHKVHDVNIADYSREMAEFKIIDENTIRVKHRVVKIFSLNQNPLTDEGTTVFDSDAVFDLHRVKILPTDLIPSLLEIQPVE